MRPDPPIDSIIWGKKYSLKDRASQVVTGLFLIFLIMLLLFGVILKDDEEHPSPIEDPSAEVRS